MSLDISAAPTRAHRVRSLAPLFRGDLVEARVLDMVVHRGIVQDKAPEARALWIISEATGKRKLISFDTFSIWMVLGT
ncbi:hypothetical protein [Arthrobacter sp. GMC3]|uniref:hypothetical protein n=1 Tax=Arthrobacter sp. GMC3 TaxID=2058894 RepID=UPI000CE338BD|nr:hypothetical protein [Arthrobacter sp. GMC3]